MRSPSEVHVKFNNLPRVKTKMMVEGRAIQQQLLQQTAQEIRDQGPYKGDLTAKVEMHGEEGYVNVGPWWIGFIEVGSVTHASRPFVAPISRRVFDTLVPKMKALGDKL
jgi:hypothetical protein